MATQIKIQAKPESEQVKILSYPLPTANSVSYTGDPVSQFLGIDL